MLLGLLAVSLDVQMNGSIKGPPSSIRLALGDPILQVPIRIVHVLDSHGQAELFGDVHTVMTLRIAEDQLTAINDIYAPCKIRFTLAPGDFETRKDDYLNLDSDIPTSLTVEASRSAKPETLGLSGHYRAFERVANEAPGKLTMIVHRGSEWRWNRRRQAWSFGVGHSHGGNWFSSKKGAYVRITGAEPIVWAHELGHSLGLPHTSRDGVDAPSALSTSDDISAACDAYLAKGGDPKHPEYAIDGEYQAGVTDTPPDPGLSFWGDSKDVTRVVEVHLRGREPYSMVVSKDNVMAADHGTRTFTQSQALLMRARIKAWLKNP